ncbi:MAG: bphO [Myxococcales bacterium]|nr:bphO [Myxococcales bacterium]
MICTRYAGMHETAMLTKLNMETRPYHCDLDGPWLELVVPHVSRHQYVEQLSRVLGFESAVEAALAYTPGFAGSIKLRDWARSSFIAKDLMALGMPAGGVAQLPQCSIEPFANSNEALGWMFVLERATLLHDGLRWHIEERVQRSPYVCSYLAANEGKDVTRWNEFGEILERAAQQQPQAADEMVRAARHACRRACEWYQQREQALRSVDEYART